jgi:hypothetical protein
MLFFFLIVGIPFVIALVAFYNPSSIENLIREPAVAGIAPPPKSVEPPDASPT